MHLAIQLACFDTIFDCITNMIGRLFDLHIVKSTPNDQTWERGGFLIFILTLTSYFMFSSCSVKCSVKMTFWYFITCYKYSIRNFQKIFHQTVILTHKIYIFVCCVSLFLKYTCIKEPKSLIAFLSKEEKRCYNMKSPSLLAPTFVVWHC